MKRALGVGLVLIATFTLSAWSADSDVVVNPYGTGAYVLRQWLPKAFLVELLVVPEDQVVSQIEEGYSLEGFSDVTELEVTERGDMVVVSVTEHFTYDASGWSLGAQSIVSPDALFEVDPSGDYATFTYYIPNMEPHTSQYPTGTEGPHGVDVNLTVTFPGPVTDTTGGGTVDGNTATWTSSQIAELPGPGQSVTATGALDSAAVPPPANESPAAPEPEGEDGEDEEDDRRRVADDRPVRTETGFDFPWRTALLIGLGALGFAGVALAVISIVRGQRPDQDHG